MGMPARSVVVLQVTLQAATPAREARPLPSAVARWARRPEEPWEESPPALRATFLRVRRALAATAAPAALAATAAKLPAQPTRRIPRQPYKLSKPRRAEGASRLRCLARNTRALRIRWMREPKS